MRRNQIGLLENSSAGTGWLLTALCVLGHVVIHTEHLLETGWLTDRVRDFIGLLGNSGSGLACPPRSAADAQSSW